VQDSLNWPQSASRHLKQQKIMRAEKIVNRKTEEEQSYLSRDGDALGEWEKDDDPAEKKAECQLPADSSHLMKTPGYIQHVVADTNTRADVYMHKQSSDQSNTNICSAPTTV